VFAIIYDPGCMGTIQAFMDEDLDEELNDVFIQLGEVWTGYCIIYAFLWKL
jgi:hypothetical protein